MAISSAAAGHRLWLRLFVARGVGAVTCARLLQTFKTVEALFAAGEEDFGKDRDLAKAWSALHRTGLDTKVDQLEEAISCVPGARITTPSTPDYPERLLRTGSVPAALFVRGLLHHQLPSVAVVGSRRANPDRAELTREWCAQLAQAGVSIVSGLAEGIDAAAHEGALQALGHTVAVLGTGLDKTYPRHHVALQDRILDAGGAVISQFPPHAFMHPGYFPARNATIAGLSDAVVVMQAASRSGALYTAGYASQYKRPVLAVPSPLGDRDNAGCLKLLRETAHAISTPADVARLLHLESPGETARPLPDLPPEELAILERLDFQAQSLDELTRRLDRPAAVVLDLLLRLELAGVVARQPGPRYVRLR